MKQLTSLESCYTAFFYAESVSYQVDLENSPFHFFIQYLVLFIPTVDSYIFSEQFLLSSLIHALLHLLIFTVSACVYGAPLHVGLLSPSHTSGAGSGTEHPEGPNFPRLPGPSPLCLFSPSVSHPRICQSGPGQSACCPPAIFHLFSHPLSYSFSSVYPFPPSLSLFLTFCLHLSVQHFLSAYLPCSSPLWPLAATVNPLHEVVSVCSSVPYVW